MKYSQQLLLAACLFLAALPVGPAAAYDQPAGLNLGGTSFLDGIPPAGPGLYFQEYIQYYTADEFPEIGAPIDPDTSCGRLGQPQPVHLPVESEALFGGKWGLNVIVPVVSIDVDDDNHILTDNGGGLGDIYVGPFLQWDPIMGENGPIFVHRVEFTTILPHGQVR